MSGYDGYDEPPQFGGNPNRGQQTHGRSFQRKSDDRGDYVEVDKRIQEFYAKYPDGRLSSRIHKLSQIDGFEVQQRQTRDQRGNTKVKDIPVAIGLIVVEGMAFRTPDDPLPGVGHSWMVLPGQTPYTLGSELENAETSAWGRAIAAVGLATRGGIATADEIRSKQTADEPTEDQPDADTPTDAPPPVAAKEGASSALPVDATTTVPRSLDGKTDEQIRAMTYEVLIELAREKFIPSATITKTGRTMFGEGHTLRQLTDEQRQQLWHALLTGELPGDEHTASPQASEPSTTSS